MEHIHFACKIDPGSVTGSNTLTDKEMLVQRETLGELVVMAELSGRLIIYGIHARGEHSEVEPKTTSQLADLTLKNLKQNVRTL